MLLNFDYDGVIAESFDHLLSVCRAAQADIGVGRPPLAEDFSTLESLTFQDLARRIDVPESNIGEYLDRIHNLLEHDTEEISFYPGITEVIRQLANNHEIVIITASNTELVRKRLSQDDLLPAIALISGSDTGLSKSERILRALAQFGHSANAAFMIGDAISDIREGKRAGVRTIAVAWGFQPRHLLAREKPDWMVNTPEELLALLGGEGTLR